MTQQAAVVNLEEASQGAGGLDVAGRRERARDQRRGAVADHPADGFLGVGRGAALLQELICRLGEIAARVDERAIEVEDDESNRRESYARYSANDVGVSQTVTRTTGSCWLLA